MKHQSILFVLLVASFSLLGMKKQEEKVTRDNVAKTLDGHLKQADEKENEPAEQAYELYKGLLVAADFEFKTKINNLAYDKDVPIPQNFHKQKTDLLSKLAKVSLQYKNDTKRKLGNEGEVKLKKEIAELRPTEAKKEVESPEQEGFFIQKAFKAITEYLEPEVETKKEQHAEDIIQAIHAYLEERKPEKEKEGGKLKKEKIEAIKTKFTKHKKQEKVDEKPAEELKKLPTSRAIDLIEKIKKPEDPKERPKLALKGCDEVVELMLTFVPFSITTELILDACIATIQRYNEAIARATLPIHRAEPESDVKKFLQITQEYNKTLATLIDDPHFKQKLEQLDELSRQQLIPPVTGPIEPELFYKKTAAITAGSAKVKLLKAADNLIQLKSIPQDIWVLRYLRKWFGWRGASAYHALYNCIFLLDALFARPAERLRYGQQLGNRTGLYKARAGWQQSLGLYRGSEDAKQKKNEFEKKAREKLEQKQKKAIVQIEASLKKNKSGLEAQRKALEKLEGEAKQRALLILKIIEEKIKGLEQEMNQAKQEAFKKLHGPWLHSYEIQHLLESETSKNLLLPGMDLHRLVTVVPEGKLEGIADAELLKKRFKETQFIHAFIINIGTKQKEKRDLDHIHWVCLVVNKYLDEQNAQKIEYIIMDSSNEDLTENKTILAIMSEL